MSTTTVTETSSAQKTKTNATDEFFAEMLTHFSSATDAPGKTTELEVLLDVTERYLDTLDPATAPAPRQIQRHLLGVINAIVASENTDRKEDKLPFLRRLPAGCIAQILLRLHHIVRIAPNARDTDREYDLTAMYVRRGPDAGLYTASEDAIRAQAREYNFSLTLREFDEILATLRELAPRTHQCQDRDLIAVNNGVFNYSAVDRTAVIGSKRFEFRAKSLHEFDPALVFLAKSRVDYVEDPDNPVITHPVDGTTWDIESWMSELSDDPEVVDLLWEICGAIIRPHVSWNKSAWFYSEQGNNGKGTLCSLMRNLTGPGSYTSIPISDFGKDFALEPLVRATAIIVDENDVGTFIDKAANLKAVVTHDVIQINRKYRAPIAYQFYGFMVQCLNEFPRVKDQSESFYRRHAFVPFTKCFTGEERRYIKDDYLARSEVLEYAMHRVLHMDYYVLSEPVATKNLLDTYKTHNDPVRAFWEDLSVRFVWDLLPFTFLYDLYLAWFGRVMPSGIPLNRLPFLDRIRQAVADDPNWEVPARDKHGKDRQARSAGRMDAPEPLIAEFDLTVWMDPSYRGPDPMKRSRPTLQDSYRGLVRTVATVTSVSDASKDDD